jgi:hypothetical protein
VNTLGLVIITMGKNSSYVFMLLVETTISTLPPVDPLMHSGTFMYRQLYLSKIFAFFTQILFTNFIRFKEQTVIIYYF